MTNQELDVFKKQAKLTGVGLMIIFSFFLFLLLFNKCNDKEVQKVDTKELREKVKKEKKERETKKDSSFVEIQKRVAINTNLQKQNELLQLEINKLKNKQFVVNKDLVSLVDFFNEHYSTTNNKVSGNYVGLGLDTAMGVIDDVSEGYNCGLTLEFKDAQLKNKDTVIENLNKDKVAVTSLLMLAEKEITNRETLQTNSDLNTKLLENDLKKLRFKNTLTKISVPVSFVLGGYIGYKLNK